MISPEELEDMKEDAVNRYVYDHKGPDIYRAIKDVERLIAEVERLENERNKLMSRNEDLRQRVAYLEEDHGP